MNKTRTPMHLPQDYEGPFGMCTCGHVGPIRDQAPTVDEPETQQLTSPKSECTQCFIERVSRELVTLSEAEELAYVLTTYSTP